MGYDLTCTAFDFSNADALSPTPSFTIGAMSFVTHGRIEVATRPFTTGSVLVDSAVGTVTQWRYDYRLDFTVLVPLANEPGTYTTTITYTFVPK